jgi:tRNA-specific 2-thiouridylase
MYDKIEGELRCKAKTRYNQTEQPCKAVQLDEDTIKITFDTPQKAITPGQSCFLYDGEYVIGGGRGTPAGMSR